MTKSKKNKGIYNLDDIIRRKRRIKDRLEICEERMQEDYFKLTHPVSIASKLLGSKCEILVDKKAYELEPSKLSYNIKRIFGFVSTAMSAYAAIKGFRR